MPAGNPGRNQAGSPERMPAGNPDRNQARRPERMPAQSPERKQASNLEKSVHINKSDKLVRKEEVHSKNEEFQRSVFKSLIASDRSDTQTSFDAVFLDTFSDVVANYQSRDKDLSERERIAFCPVNTSQQNEELKEMLQQSTK